jgi:AcrR family transcriptional regulator
MNTKDNRRSQNSRVRMEQAFLELIHKRESEKVSVKAICTLAGVNRSTFYAHYLDIYDLVAHIQEGKQRQVLQMVDTTLAADLSNFVAVIEQLFEFVKTNREFYQIYLANHSGISLLDSKVLTEFSKSQRAYLPQTKIARAYRMTFFVAGLGAVMRRWLREGCLESSKSMAELIEAEYRVKDSGIQ